MRPSRFIAFITAILALSSALTPLAIASAQENPSPRERAAVQKQRKLPNHARSQTNKRPKAQVITGSEGTAQGGFFVIKVITPDPAVITTFNLKEPARLVIDFQGTTARSSEPFVLPSNRVVSSVRFGHHHDRMRVVIDFKQREMPYYESKVTSRQIILKIRESGAAAPAVTRHTPIAQLAEAPAAVATALPPTPQAPRTSAPLPLIPTLAPTPAETETPAATQTAAATATAAPTHTATAVSEYHLLDYRFEYVEESRIPVLKLLLDKSRPQAQISKVDERTYVIEVANCGLVRPSLALPQYPPSDFAGFLMVSSIASAERLTITITVDSGTTLGTFVKGSEIWVKRLS